MTDLVTNFGKAIVSTTYDEVATSIVLTGGHGAKFPTAIASDNKTHYNLVWYCSTDYPDPADDPNVEIVRVTNLATDTLTVVRAQEGTSASTKNTAGKTYKMILAPTRKTILDLQIKEPTEYLATISHANSVHRDTGVAFTVGSFMKHGYIKKMTIRGSYTCGTLYSFSALASNAVNGVTPAVGSFAFYSKSGSIFVDDFVGVDNEIMRVSGTTTTYLTVTRGVKGTSKTYHEHNATVTKMVNGVRVHLYPNISKKETTKVLELNNVLIYSGLTSGSISTGGTVITMTAAPRNLYKDDYILIQDTIPETAIVQKTFGSVKGASDNTIFVFGTLSTHVSAKNVQKLITYDVPTSYKGSSNTLYGHLYMDERLPAGTIGITLGITVDKFGSIVLS